MVIIAQVANIGDTDGSLESTEMIAALPNEASIPGEPEGYRLSW